METLKKWENRRERAMPKRKRAERKSQGSEIIPRRMRTDRQRQPVKHEEEEYTWYIDEDVLN